MAGTEQLRALTGTDSPIVWRLPLLLPTFALVVGTVWWIGRPATYAALQTAAQRGEVA